MEGEQLSLKGLMCDQILPSILGVCRQRPRGWAAAVGGKYLLPAAQRAVLCYGSRLGAAGGRGGAGPTVGARAGGGADVSGAAMLKRARGRRSFATRAAGR